MIKTSKKRRKRLKKTLRRMKNKVSVELLEARKQLRLQFFKTKMRTKGMLSFKSTSQNKKSKNKNTTHEKKKFNNNLLQRKNKTKL
jgi:hypothetical protein